jgi:hypothetical protein
MALLHQSEERPAFGCSLAAAPVVAEINLVPLANVLARKSFAVG